MTDLFYTDIPQATDCFTAISFLTDKLLQKDYVDDSFEEAVLAREKAASTAFTSIAIPHSFENNAQKTAISVLIMHDGINWNGQMVNIVLLLCLSPYESNIFNNLYEALTMFFADEKNVETIRACTDFYEFKNTLLSLV